MNEKTVILNVDDDEGSRYAVTRILKRAGYAVIEAATGKETLKIAETMPDLILLDIRLPDMDGFTVCRRLKENPKTESIPVLHLSATYKAADSFVKGLEGGADGYLVHPVEPEVLIAYVRTLLRLRETERQAIEALKRWDETFNAIESGIFLIAPDGAVERVNKSACEIIGKTVGELQERPLREILIEWGLPEGSCILKEEWSDLKRKSTTFERGEYESGRLYFAGYYRDETP